ncbi:hypothetical protein Q1695_007882 [Nippostrongylus brasiliensis]|nr:hypothetical protein Q1695_007882 [Nippostrongylus brasiliensis]
MTVSYNLDISSVSVFVFMKLLFRWRGSIWKLIMNELLVWLCGYYVVLAINRCLLPDEARKYFERIAEHFDSLLVYIPLTFMLGFFVTIVVDRWKNIFMNLGWIENLAFTLSLLRGTSEKFVNYRRSIVRYALLTQVLVFRDISIRVRRRFPSLESLVETGYLTKSELVELENIRLSYNKYWAPVNWALTICVRAYKEDCFYCLPHMVAVEEVVFLAVRVYFVVCAFTRTVIRDAERNEHIEFNTFIPFMTVLEFIFIVGWMKVAEVLLNPLGEDDDHFECNFLIDQNTVTGMSIVDDTFGICPTLIMDRFSDPNYKPPYIRHRNRNPFQGSVESVKFRESTKKEASDKQSSGHVKSRPKSSVLKRAIDNIFGFTPRRSSVHAAPMGRVYHIPFDWNPPQVMVDVPRATSPEIVVDLVDDDRNVCSLYIEDTDGENNSDTDDNKGTLTDVIPLPLSTTPIVVPPDR